MTRPSTLHRWADFVNAALTLAAYTAPAILLLGLLAALMRDMRRQDEPIAATCSPDATTTRVRTCP